MNDLFDPLRSELLDAFIDAWVDDLEIRWELERSPSITTMSGCWSLQESDGECIADYEAEVETNLAVPPEVQAMFVEESLPKLMEKFRDRAEEL